VIRLVDLARPATLVFDETYYAKDAYSLLKFGYERGWPDWANDSIVAGQPDVYNSDAAFIVHPQVGKWLIALGEHVFGMTSFGWRFPALVAGSLMIAVVVRLARRLSRSLLVGAMAGTLLTFDGLHFVMSRIALLDIFQSLFIVSAVMCVVADRDRFRHRLADHLTRQGLTTLGGQAGPGVFRPWMIASGVLWGLAIGTEWNSAYALACRECSWSPGRSRPGASPALGSGRGSPCSPTASPPSSLVVLAGFVYVATWASWLATSGGYDRQWEAGHPTLRRCACWVRRRSLLQYQDIYAFHTGDYIKQSNHPYAAHPAGWLVLARPIGIDAVNDIQPGAEGCAGPETCLRVITANGTPVLWWAAAIALVVSLVWWVAGRDWRFGTPAALALSTYLPWFAYTERSLFFFYAITIVPFTAICLALCLGQILGPPGDG
jgi:dolichyl-phosphate-mannose--protein O-mannosyl transferase